MAYNGTRRGEWHPNSNHRDNFKTRFKRSSSRPTGSTTLAGADSWLVDVPLIASPCGGQSAWNHPSNVTAAPADDPGWNNFSTAGSYVYLGDGWVLSARHVGYNNGMQFQTPTGTVTAHRIPGRYYTDYYGFLHDDGIHYYAISNPTTVQSEAGSPITLSPYTDLQLFRVHAEREIDLPSLKIASEPLPNNFGLNNAPQVLAIAGGPGRIAAESSWSVTGTSPNLTWTTPPNGSTDHHGYVADFISTRRWGTNRVSDPGDSADLFSGVVSNTTGVFQLDTGVGAKSRDILSLMTTYDNQNQSGATTHETQAINNDSGGAVFYKRGTQWELAGIINAQVVYEDQPLFTAIYGNVTTMAALSHYNQNYAKSTSDIMSQLSDYSIMGDVNLDGVVTGNGTGPALSDDVTAFVAGWNYDNGTGTGTVTSWKHGDLNRDGRTDVADFLKLRSGLNGPISSAVVAALFGSSDVPEPSTAMLAMLAASLMAGTRRRSRMASPFVERAVFVARLTLRYNCLLGEESIISLFLGRNVNPTEYNRGAACLSHRQVSSCAGPSVAGTNRPCGSRFFLLVRPPYSWR